VQEEVKKVRAKSIKNL
jgi:hypothetical protein